MYLFNLLKDKPKPRKRRLPWASGRYLNLGMALTLISVVLVIGASKLKTWEGMSLNVQRWGSFIAYAVVTLMWSAVIVLVYLGMKKGREESAALWGLLERSGRLTDEDVQREKKDSTWRLFWFAGILLCNIFAFLAGRSGDLTIKKIALAALVGVMSLGLGRLYCSQREREAQAKKRKKK